MAQPGTAQAWNFVSGSLFPQGYPGSNPGRGVLLFDVDPIFGVFHF